MLSRNVVNSLVLMVNVLLHLVFGCLHICRDICAKESREKKRQRRGKRTFISQEKVILGASGDAAAPGCSIQHTFTQEILVQALQEALQRPCSAWTCLSQIFNDSSAAASAAAPPAAPDARDFQI